jgi:demethylmenaquinone methyltransferase/2-methoxy-6-polyprenyl-1,4-benzoquinol methylase
MPLIEHFDIIAPYYDRIFSSNHSEKLYELIELPISGSLLDAGGGTGRISDKFKNEAGLVVISDLSGVMLNKALEKGGLFTVCSHTEFLPYPNGYFERIIMVDVFHHVCDQQLTVNELWRVLAPGGRIIIEEPDTKNFGVKMVALAEKIALMRSKFLSPQSIKSMFRFQGVKTRIETEGYNSWVVVDKSSINN